MFSTYTVTAQWWSIAVTEFEVEAESVREAKVEAEELLGGPLFPPGGTLMAIRKGSGLGFWDRLLEKQERRLAEYSSAWWLPYFVEDETDEEEKTPVSAK